MANISEYILIYTYRYTHISLCIFFDDDATRKRESHDAQYNIIGTVVVGCVLSLSPRNSWHGGQTAELLDGHRYETDGDD